MHPIITPYVTRFAKSGIVTTSKSVLGCCTLKKPYIHTSRELGPIIIRATILSMFKFEFQQEMISQSNSKFDAKKTFYL
jgi:hypothetical protein